MSDNKSALWGMAILLLSAMATLLVMQDLTMPVITAAVFIGLALIVLLVSTRRVNVQPQGDQLVMAAGRNAWAVERILPLIGDAIPDPMIILDQRGTVLLCNMSARRLLEMDPRGQHVSTGIRAPSILDAIDEVAATRTVQQVDYEVRVPIERRFEALVAPLQWMEARKGESIPSVLVLMRDLTRAYQVERMRADFIANASHELRTPLASVLGFIETLQGAAKNDTAARERFLELMRIQGYRMTRLIDDLLSLSRIEMNAHLLPTETINVEQIVRHVVDVLSPLATEHGVEVKLSISTDVPPLTRGARDELVQVFENLIENALKYSHDGKLIEVNFETKAGFVDVSIRDHGPGIPEEHLPRLTERFYRVSTQDSRARGGTGLGLAIVKHILNRHRGKLRIKSTVGEGSTFTVRLPLAPNPNPVSNQ
ncbi:two-component system phosphate regulon sensor histidine kinase PhoR [Rhodoligotrophos appendicifer]|uniref:phosphate regulon sensor histidine kinase PhoR n=1 Tax=Rhodoligotrophos appendicifer TaxID=987056 RepID=UPI001180DB93|nr:phosphate regulon sensor histidine kinase PhoR [Rhodoligotrophos appendicifer]